MTTQLEDQAKRLSPHELVDFFRNSSFNRSSYSVDISLSNFFQNISMYTHGEEYSSASETKTNNLPNVEHFTLDENPSRLFECVPAFQRKNDKWTEDMQVSFMTNVMAGYKTTLMFYEVTEERSPNLTACMIIDGLQRLTAIYRFLTNQIKVKGYTYQELLDNRVMYLNRITIKLSNYAFATEIEAVEFYIAMNENMTHSKSDIQNAKDYLKILKDARDADLTKKEHDKN